jgi:hypothetical protein
MARSASYYGSRGRSDSETHGKKGKRKAPRSRRDRSRDTVCRTAYAVHGLHPLSLGCVASLLAHGYRIGWRYAPIISNNVTGEIILQHRVLPTPRAVF